MKQRLGAPLIGLLMAFGFFSLPTKAPSSLKAAVAHPPNYVYQYHSYEFVDTGIANGTNVNANTIATVTSTGKVFTQGYGTLGGIGNGALLDSNIPVDITGSFGLTSSDKIILVEGGSAGTFLALSQEGRLFAWGYTARGVTIVDDANDKITTPTEITSYFSLNTGSSEKIVDVKVGDYVAIARTSLNRFFTWGLNADGRLGRFPSDSSSEELPGLLKKDASTDFLLGSEIFRDFGLFDATGYILTNSNLYTWGLNTQYQAGDGTNVDVFYPTSIKSKFGLAGGESIVSASIGLSHGLVATSTGRIFGWGSNPGSSYPLTRYVTTLTTPTDLSTYFIDEQEHYSGETPFSALNAGEKITRVLAFENTSYAEVSDNNVVDYYIGWGLNGTGASTAIGYYYNILGTYSDGSTVEVPTQWVSSYDLLNSEDYQLTIFNRGYNTIIKTSENLLHFIGNNSYGQLGNGLSGMSFSTDLSWGFNTYEYAYVPSYNYNAKYLEIYYIDKVSMPLTKDSFNDSEQDALMYELVNLYYGTLNNEYNNSWANLDDAGRDLIDPQIIYDIEAAFYDYDIQYYFKNFYDTVEQLETAGSTGRLDARNWAQWLVDYKSPYVDYERSLSQSSIDQLETASETIREELETILTNVTAFETKLKAFRTVVDIYDSTAFNETSYPEYEDAMLELFDAYEALLAKEKLYFDVYDEYTENYDYLYGYYEDIIWSYVQVNISAYEAKLSNFWDIENADGYFGLLANLDQIKTVLPQINNLPDRVYDYYTYYNDYTEMYDYESYDYWQYLNSLLPALEEAKSVYDTFIINQVDVDWNSDTPVNDKSLAESIIANYKAYLELSPEAQALFDEEEMYSYYYEALSYFTRNVSSQLYNLSDLEYNEGTPALFDKLDAISKVLTDYEALTEDMVALLSEEEIAYYNYLKGLKPALEEAKSVHDTFQADQIEVDWNSDTPINDKALAQSIIANYQAYLALSPEAQALFDAEEMYNYYFEAMKFFTREVETKLNDLSTIENNGGVPALFDELTNITDAIAKYDALTLDMLDLLSEETKAYYEYLKTLQPTLAEAKPVDDLIKALPSLDLINHTNIEQLLLAIKKYEELSADAKELVDGDLLYELLFKVTQKTLDELPATDKLTLDDEAAVKNARLAFNKLTPAQQAALGTDYLDRLVAAEAQLAALQNNNDWLATWLLVLLHLAAGLYFIYRKKENLLAFFKK